MGVDAQVGGRRLGRERRGESADASGRRAAARGFFVILPSGRLFRGRGRGGRRARVPGTRPLTPLAAVSGRSRRVRCESRRGGGRGSRRDAPGRPHERRGRRGGGGRRSPRARGFAGRGDDARRDAPRRRLRGVHLGFVSNPFVDRLGPRRLRRVPGRRELSPRQLLRGGSELGARRHRRRRRHRETRRRAPPRTRATAPRRRRRPWRPRALGSRRPL